MKKVKFGRKLSRGQGARKALFRSMIKALVAHGSIITTKAKAKSIQKKIEKLIKTAKVDNVATRRRVFALLGNDRVTMDKLFNYTAKKFIDKKGGYTRIINLPKRRGDMAEMVRFEFVEKLEELKIAKKSDEKKTSKKGLSALSKLAGRGKLGK